MTDNSLPPDWRKYGNRYFVSMDEINRYGIPEEEMFEMVYQKMEREIVVDVTEAGLEIKRGPRREKEFEDSPIMGRGYMLRLAALVGPKQ